MCHADSFAPALDGSTTVVSRHTADSEAVPYLELAKANSEPRSRIVLLTDIFGITPFYRHLGKLLTERGYSVVIPDIFHRVGAAANAGREAAVARRAELDDERALQDIQLVIDDAIRPSDSYGLMGFCIGGSFALLAAASRPHQATVTYYAFPRGAPGATMPTTAPLDVASDIRGDVLAFWGRQDYIDARDVDALEAELTRSPGGSEVVWFERAGHSFLAGLAEPDHEAASAATEAWLKTVTFFDDRLGNR